MIRYIKNHIPFLWVIIDCVNSIICHAIFGADIAKINKNILEFDHRLHIKFVDSLLYTDACKFFMAIPDEDKQYFRPFEFTPKSIESFLSRMSNAVFLIYNGDTVIGAFFLRFFITRQAFLGFIVNSQYRGKGLGTMIIKTLANACRSCSFTLYSTVSSDNKPSWKSHIKNDFVVQKEIGKSVFLMRLR